MKAPRSHSLVSRLVSAVLLPALVMGSVPLSPAPLRAEEAAPTSAASPAPEAPQVNRTVPEVDPQASSPRFSAPPTDAEIFAARVFAEPLTQLGATSPAENTALARAIEAYLGRASVEDLSPFQAFLDGYPNSAWKASLLSNMGIVWRRTGYFTRALEAWETAWGLGKDAEEPNAKATADRTLAEFLELNARLGRHERLESLLDEVQGRDVRGAATERLSAARQALYLMRNRPEASFRCGPLALAKIQRATVGHAVSPKLVEAESTPQGTSLVQMAALAREAGMEMQPAHRSPAGAFIVPAMVHWKAGHFAAITEQQADRFKIEDPTFGEEMWVSQAALLAETSGYFLVPGGSLPPGWRAVGNDEAATVWGKGAPGGQNTQAQTPATPQVGGAGPGGSTCRMAVYSFHTMLANLHITDSPVGYTPSRGPDLEFQVTYNQRDAFQPQIFTYSNLGQKWTFDWLSYITDDPGLVGQTPTLYVRGGGQETYTGFNSSTNSYAPHYMSHAVLVRVSGSPIRYERLLPDGSKEVFALPDGAQTAPRKIFMTEWRDPQGNAVQLTYDFVFGTNPRLLTLRDAVGPGQVTTLSYELPGDPLKITKVTDPFGRFATFEYNAQSQLKKITDVIGITSEFTYGMGDFIQSLTTPYGATLFAMGDDGRQRWIQATDPLGGKELLYYQNNAASAVPASASPSVVPTGFESLNILHSGVSFFWDKIAMARAEGDFNRALATYWMWTPGGLADAVKRIEKAPLENPVWYTHPGDIGRQLWGDSLPNQVARVLDNGTSQIYRFEYNSRAKVCKATDPLGRETLYTYGANNVADAVCTSGSSIDLLKVEQKNGANYDLLESRTYNSQHEPLTVTDASGQTTTYTYLPDGRLQTEVTPPRAGLTAAERTTTYAYYPDNAPTGAGRLQTVTGPSTPQGPPVTSYTYDGYSRVRTVTDPDTYALTYDYDALDRPTKTTYPDATYEETAYNRLDTERQRDRLGRWTHTFHDALRRPVAIRDPRGQTATLQWCTCGSLEKVIDPNGNATSWERDVQGRVTRAVRADGTDATLTYENTTSRPLQFRDPKLQLATIQYFADNNWKQVTFSNTTQPTPTVSFTYDVVYNRLATMTDGMGATTYSFNPVVVPPTLGAARLASVDGTLANDVITYSYDELGRVSGRSINGVALSQSYDALGRVTGETNALGAFAYGYDGVTDRLASLGYPNGQTTTLGYFGNPQDHRLQDLHNKRAGGATLSRFQYTYAANGAITNWNQQTDSNPAKAYDLGRDAVDQLTTATLRTTDPTPAILKRYRYSYDEAENRTGEQIDDASTSASVNTLNAITALQPGGALQFAGTVNEAATVTVQGKPAQVTASNQFAGSASVPSGTSTVAVVAADPSGNTRTNTYQVTESGSTKTLTYDSNGSLTSDGTRTFEWDGADRLTAVNQGTHRSEFTYDGWSHRVRIVEKDNSVVTSDRRFLWCGTTICEERDASGSSVTRRFLDQGMQESGSAFFYTADHLGSIRELTDTAGVIRARYDYDPYGKISKLSGDKDSFFGFTGHFSHGPSVLALAPYRAYDASLGRWISPDPLDVASGLNLYAYVNGRPVDARDPLGLLVAEGAGTAAVVAGGAGAGAAAAAAAAGLAAGFGAWWLYKQTGLPWPPWYPPKDPQTDPSNSSNSQPSAPQTSPSTQPTTQPTSGPSPTVVPPSPTASPTCEPEDPCKKIREDCAKRCKGSTLTRAAFVKCYKDCVRIMSKGKCEPI